MPCSLHSSWQTGGTSALITGPGSCSGDRPGVGQPPGLSLMSRQSHEAALGLLKHTAGWPSALGRRRLAPPLPRGRGGDAPLFPRPEARAVFRQSKSNHEGDFTVDPWKGRAGCESNDIQSLYSNSPLGWLQTYRHIHIYTLTHLTEPEPIN